MLLIMLVLTWRACVCACVGGSIESNQAFRIHARFRTPSGSKIDEESSFQVLLRLLAAIWDRSGDLRAPSKFGCLRFGQPESINTPPLRVLFAAKTL